MLRGVRSRLLVVEKGRGCQKGLEEGEGVCGGGLGGCI
jgi:hypothetical protein